MGVCCAHGQRESEIDKGEKSLRSSIAVPEPISDKSIGPKLSRDEKYRPEEIEFKQKALEIKSPNENTNV